MILIFSSCSTVSVLRIIQILLLFNISKFQCSYNSLLHNLLWAVLRLADGSMADKLSDNPPSQRALTSKLKDSMGSVDDWDASSLSTIGGSVIASMDLSDLISLDPSAVSGKCHKGLWILALKCNCVFVRWLKLFQPSATSLSRTILRKRWWQRKSLKGWEASPALLPGTPTRSKSGFLI